MTNAWASHAIASATASVTAVSRTVRTPFGIDANTAMSTGGYRRPGPRVCRWPVVLTRCSITCPCGYSGGTLVPMASSMARRLALVFACIAAAMVVAVPAAQARTHLHADRPRMGPRHRPFAVRRARLRAARMGLRRDPGPLLPGDDPVPAPELGADAHPARERPGVLLDLGRVQDHGRRRGRDDRRRRFRPATTASSGGRRAACASSTPPPTRASSSTSPARSGWAARRRSGSTAASASAGRTTTGTAALRVIRSGSSLMLIDVVPLEYYLRGVVPSEMPSSWLAPALRAQAVAARSYAVATRHPTSLFDAYADTRSQVYGPIEHEAAGVDRGRLGDRAPGAVVLRQRRRRVLLVVVGRLDGVRAGGVGERQRAVPRPGPRPLRRRAGAEPEPQLEAEGASRRAGWRRALGVTGKVRSVDLTIDGPSQRVTHATFHTRRADHALQRPGRRVGARPALELLPDRRRHARRAGAVDRRHAVRRSPAACGRCRTTASRSSCTTGRASRGRRPTARLSLNAHGTFSIEHPPEAEQGVPARRCRPARSRRAQKIKVGPELTLVRSGKAFRATIFPVLAGREAHAPATPGGRLEGRRRRHGRRRAATPGSRSRGRRAGGASPSAATRTTRRSHSPTLTSPKIWRG